MAAASDARTRRNRITAGRKAAAAKKRRALAPAPADMPAGGYTIAEISARLAANGHAAEPLAVAELER